MSADARGHVSPNAVALLYVPRDGDATAACVPVAGVPLGFRALMSAVRGGCLRIGVPAVFRQTAVERAIRRSAAARRCAVWLDHHDVSSLVTCASRVLLVPVTAALPPASVTRLLAERAPARLSSAPSTAPIALVPPGAAARVAGLVRSGEPAGDAIRARLEDLAPRTVAGSWCIVPATGAARRDAERRLYGELGSAIDTRLDTAVHRPCSRRLTRAALHLGVTANAVSLASLGVGLAAAAALTEPTTGAALLGMLLYFASVVLDHSDGEVARLRYAESRLGEWLDVSVDTIVHVACALGLGVAADRAAGWGGWLGLGAAAGFAASALVVKTAPPPAGGAAPTRLVAALAARDGFYILLALHVLVVTVSPPSVPWLLAATAAAAHLFWPSALISGHRSRRDAAASGRRLGGARR